MTILASLPKRKPQSLRGPRGLRFVPTDHARERWRERITPDDWRDFPLAIYTARIFAHTTRGGLALWAPHYNAICITLPGRNGGCDTFSIATVFNAECFALPPSEHPPKRTDFAAWEYPEGGFQYTMRVRGLHIAFWRYSGACGLLPVKYLPR